VTDNRTLTTKFNTDDLVCDLARLLCVAGTTFHKRLSNRFISPENRNVSSIHMQYPRFMHLPDIDYFGFSVNYSQRHCI